MSFERLHRQLNLLPAPFLQGYLALTVRRRNLGLLGGKPIPCHQIFFCIQACRNTWCVYSTIPKDDLQLVRHKNWFGRESILCKSSRREPVKRSKAVRRGIWVAICQGELACLGSGPEAWDFECRAFLDLWRNINGTRPNGGRDAFRELSFLLWLCDNGIEVDGWSDEVNVRSDTCGYAIIVAC